MRKRIILIIALILVASILFLSFGISKQSITGGTISAYKYSYTEAKCNETNYCQDYIITCDNKTIINQTSITGAAVQYSDDWEDPRGNNIINDDCNLSY